VADRAGSDEAVERAQRLLERRLLIVEVRVVEVDAIGLQALERSAGLALDRLCVQVATSPRPPPTFVARTICARL
jgi:hypothetical protein